MAFETTARAQMLRALVPAVVLLAGGFGAVAAQVPASSDVASVLRYERLTEEAQHLFPPANASLEYVAGGVRLAGIMKTASRCSELRAESTRAGNRIVVAITAAPPAESCTSAGPGWFGYRVAVPDLPPGQYQVRVELLSGLPFPVNRRITRDFEVDIS